MKKAVDLDGTLARYDGMEIFEYDPKRVGSPIIKMVNRVKRWLANGDEVVIFTARVHPKHGLSNIAMAEKAIKEWCKAVIGRELEITCMKDPEIQEFWDDKAIRVGRDNGNLEVYVEKPEEGDGSIPHDLLR